MNNHINLQIGKRIKELRRDKNLTQAEFAEKIMRDRSIISKLESGEIELSPSIGLAICNVFGVRKEWLLTGIGEKYDDRWALLETRAQELGEDIYIELSTIKSYKQAYLQLLERVEALEKASGQAEFTPKELEYTNKLLTIFRQKDDGTISAITQNIDTFLKVPDKEISKEKIPLDKKRKAQ